MTGVSELTCDLAVIGAGLAGTAAALFAAGSGVSTIRVGMTSQIIFASGFVDLLGVHPIAGGRLWGNPWQAVEALRRDIPDHPYARIKTRNIRKALDEFFSALESAGVSYRCFPDRNAEVMLPVGTVKPTYGVPASMWNGVTALAEKPPVRLIDIRGLRAFSSRQIAETLAPVWPGLRHARIVFPGLQQAAEVYAEPMARSLMLAETRRRLAEVVRPHVKGARMIGFPAIFGVQNTLEIISDMENRLGIPVFEIPTLPPAIPGLRINEAMDALLREKGVRSLVPHRVLNARPRPNGFVLKIGDALAERTVRAKAVILATGRFIGKGLTADRKRIREAVFDLPVTQPGDRSAWHRRHFLDPRGHAINLSGIEIDHRFRPLARNGRPVAANLFAAGSILAHQDWMRMKCGGGLAIATAYAAVRSYLGKPV